MPTQTIEERILEEKERVQRMYMCWIDLDVEPPVHHKADLQEANKALDNLIGLVKSLYKSEIKKKVEGKRKDVRDKRIHMMKAGLSNNAVRRMRTRDESYNQALDDTLTIIENI